MVQLDQRVRQTVRRTLPPAASTTKVTERSTPSPVRAEEEIDDPLTMADRRAGGYGSGHRAGGAGTVGFITTEDEECVRSGRAGFGDRQRKVISYQSSVAGLITDD
jgi:hypothetical protein